MVVLFGVGVASGDGGGWSDIGFDGGILIQMIRLAFDEPLMGQDAAHNPHITPFRFLFANLGDVFCEDFAKLKVFPCPNTK